MEKAEETKAEDVANIEEANKQEADQNVRPSLMQQDEPESGRQEREQHQTSSPVHDSDSQ